MAATLEQYRAHDWDFIKLNPRASYFAEAWGSRYEPPTEQRQPRALGHAVSSVDDLAALRPVDPRGGVFGEHLTALRLLLDEVGAEVDVVHTVFSPLSVVGRLCGAEQQLREYAAADPASTHAAVAAATETLTGYAQAALEARAAGIFFAPLAWASHDTCSEEFYREFGRPYDLQLLARVRDAEFNILHVCRSHNMIDLLLDYPVAAVNWADRGEGNPALAEVRQRTQKAVMGGVDQPGSTSSPRRRSPRRRAMRWRRDRSGSSSPPAARFRSRRRGRIERRSPPRREEADARSQRAELPHDQFIGRQAHHERRSEGHTAPLVLSVSKGEPSIRQDPLVVGHLEDMDAGTATVVDLDADGVAGAGLPHCLALDLHRLHRLAEVGGVALDVNRISTCRSPVSSIPATPMRAK